MRGNIIYTTITTVYTTTYTTILLCMRVLGTVHLQYIQLYTLLYTTCPHYYYMHCVLILLSIYTCNTCRAVRRAGYASAAGGS